MAIAIKVVAAAGNEDLRRSRRRSAQVLFIYPERMFCIRCGSTVLWS